MIASGRRRPPGIGPLRLLVLASSMAGAAHGGRIGPRSEYWVVSTRDCPQVMGTDPRPVLKASRLDDRGRLAPGDPSALPRIAAGRPVIVLVHGSYYPAEKAAAEGLRIRDDLAILGALPAGSVVVAFDWPSQRVYPNPIRDANEKGRRAFVAGYHLARFLQGFPPESRVCLIGHSHGGLVVLSALHLLGSGFLDDGDRDCPMSRLPAGQPALRPTAVVIASASDRHWLDPGERLDRALPASGGVLCLYNRLDPVLPVHPLGSRTDHRPALGLRGLNRRDRERLGPMAARYSEQDLGPLIGVSHDFRGTVAVPSVARWIAPYARPGAPLSPS